jgi:uncharacterized protein (DUF2237 family)
MILNVSWTFPSCDDLGCLLAMRKKEPEPYDVIPRHVSFATHVRMAAVLKLQARKDHKEDSESNVLCPRGWS